MCVSDDLLQCEHKEQEVLVGVTEAKADWRPIAECNFNDPHLIQGSRCLNLVTEGEVTTCPHITESTFDGWPQCCPYVGLKTEE